MASDISVCLVLDKRQRKRLFHSEIRALLDYGFEIPLVLIDKTYKIHESKPKSAGASTNLVSQFNTLVSKLMKREFDVLIKAEQKLAHRLAPETMHTDEFDKLLERVDVFESVPQLEDCEVIKFEPVKVDSIRYDFPEHIIQRITSTCDVVVLAGFNRILTGDILTAPKFGVLNCHPSDITKYRGRPHGFFQWINGEEEIGMTLQQLTEELDGGRILLQDFADISHAKSWKEVRLEAYRLRNDMIARGLLKLQNEDFEPEEPELGKLTKSTDREKFTNATRCVVRNVHGRYLK